MKCLKSIEKQRTVCSELCRIFIKPFMFDSCGVDLPCRFHSYGFFLTLQTSFGFSLKGIPLYIHISHLPIYSVYRTYWRTYRYFKLYFYINFKYLLNVCIIYYFMCLFNLFNYSTSFRNINRYLQLSVLFFAKHTMYYAIYKWLKTCENT